MSKELLLLRHGKSDWHTACDDFQRPLKKRGIRGARKLGLWVREQGLQPDYIMSSPARRVIDTAQAFVETMGGDPRSIHQDIRIYLARAATLKRVVADCPGPVGRVLIVGHNPGLEDLLLELGGLDVEIPDDGKLLPTATLARLKISGTGFDLKPGCAQLLSITRATSLY